MKDTRKDLLHQTHQRIFEIITGELPVKEAVKLIDDKISGFGTTWDEMILSKKDYLGILENTRNQQENYQLEWNLKPFSYRMLANDTVAVLCDEVNFFSPTDTGEKIEMFLRYTGVYEYTGEKWLLIHFHGSKPEFVDSAIDSFGIEHLKEKNEELKEEVKKRTARLEESLSRLRATQEQLIHSEKMASLGELTAGIAHEIKNPLNFVNNFSDLNVELIDESFEELDKIGSSAALSEAREILEDVKSNLEKIKQHGSRADSIVKSMLQHSRGGNGKAEKVDFNGLVKEYVNLAFHGMRAGKKPINVSIDYHLDEKIDKVPVIQEDFSRVILNLCNNAFDAMHEKLNVSKTQGEYSPKLKVKTYGKGDKIILEIEDNGPGISDEYKSKILQPFFTTKKGTEGTGLGLSITNDIIKAHGGELKVESKTDNKTYSRFIIQLKK
ncbi:ATP-binding protein [Christiangramia sabulilitoris]|uniref:histidine kinase n=1 Tax=Christiangramia sabulilitoris TaxID=2583991 RepID=A0A550HZK9_9FLAO|nr:ATP-binding protein [Christiangramia sabulilitoris]TRO64162.1 GHKL domain-containing protein [Christiangramia sabulilitoris]